MIKTIFFSLFRSAILSIIISLIAYNIYSPLKKNPIYNLEMNFEPNQKILIINSDNPTKIDYKEDGQNDYFTIKILENLLLKLHENGSVGQCTLKKIDGRIPYTLTKENKYIANINLSLTGYNVSALEKCSIEIKKRINDFYEERKNILLDQFNELQSYNMQYTAEKNSLSILLQMGMFAPSNLQYQDENFTQDRKEIFDQITENFLKYQLALDKQARERISKYSFIEESKVKIYIDEDIKFQKLSPIIILINFFLIATFTFIDLIFIKKIKFKKILNGIFK